MDLKNVKAKIRTINPEITDELLDLLYEYIVNRYSETLEEHINQLETNTKFRNVVQNIALKSI